MHYDSDGVSLVLVYHVQVRPPCLVSFFQVLHTQATIVNCFRVEANPTLVFVNISARYSGSYAKVIFSPFDSAMHS